MMKNIEQSQNANTRQSKINHSDNHGSLIHNTHIFLLIFFTIRNVGPTSIPEPLNGSCEQKYFSNTIFTPTNVIVI